MLTKTERARAQGVPSAMAEGECVIDMRMSREEDTAVIVPAMARQKLINTSAMLSTCRSSTVAAFDSEGAEAHYDGKTTE
jgi:hypothetical protein